MVYICKDFLNLNKDMAIKTLITVALDSSYITAPFGAWIFVPVPFKFFNFGVMALLILTVIGSRKTFVNKKNSANSKQYSKRPLSVNQTYMEGGLTKNTIIRFL
jgi:hypothetical protein